MLPLPSLPARPPYASLCGNSNALLLVVTDVFGAPQRSTLDALRLELCALSSALLVVADEQTFYFNSRPPHDARTLPAALESAALSALRQSCGGARRGPGGVTLSLLEPDGRERFRLSRRLWGCLPEALLEALQIARQSVHLPATFSTFSKRELLFYSLVGALNLVLSDVTAPPSAQMAQA